MIGAYLAKKLLTDSAMTALVGQRIKPIQALQDSQFPAIRYVEVNTATERTQNHDAIESHTVTFLIFAYDYKVCKQISELISDKFDWFFDSKIKHCEKSDERDLENEFDKDGKVVFGVELNINILS